MPRDDATLIRESFAHLHRRKAESGAVFYDRLFEIAPAVRPLFKGDAKAQNLKLMDTLTVAVAMLGDRDGLGAMLRKLGREHKAYGVVDSHYASVGAALIWTLKTQLGLAFSSAHERAWTDLYGEISGIMMAAARDA